MPRSDALKEAQRRWRKNNPRAADISRKRSAAKSYIINHASVEDIKNFVGYFADANADIDLSAVLHELEKIPKK